MFRLEVFANQSVQEEIVKVFERHQGTRYTWTPSVYGRGRSDWKLGTTAWPEENFQLVSYQEENVGASIVHELGQLKAEFPKEGICVFILPGAVSPSQSALESRRSEKEEP